MSVFNSAITKSQHDLDLRNPALCEELRLRDILDNLVVTTSGAFVAAYTLSGIQSQYHTEEARNRTKESLEAVLRALPERSMRCHVRFEIRQDAGAVVDRYIRSSRTENTVLRDIDKERQRQWREKEAAGDFLDFRLNVMLHWDPEIHHIQRGQELEHRVRRSWNLSGRRSVERTRLEHEKLVSEFESILAGIETTLDVVGMEFRRLTDDEIFFLMMESLNPTGGDFGADRPRSWGTEYQSIRSHVSTVSIEGESDEYLKVGGLLYSFVSVKDPPDSTSPGLLRELLALDFPIVVNTEIVIPDQAKVISHYKWQQRKMTAAQRDINGGFRVNVEAQVAERQLIKVLEDVVSSSLKTCRVSLVVGVRTSSPIRTSRELEEAERILSDRRQRVLHTITRMSGSRGLVETLANPVNRSRRRWQRERTAQAQTVFRQV